ncbi:PEP-CTERM sorting domain-containing protein [Phycisphaerales bacterium ac7]
MAADAHDGHLRRWLEDLRAVLAPDGTARFVELTGVVPAPGTAILLGLAGVGAARRRR